MPIRKIAIVLLTVSSFTMIPSVLLGLNVFGSVLGAIVSGFLGLRLTAKEAPTVNRMLIFCGIAAVGWFFLSSLRFSLCECLLPSSEATLLQQFMVQ